MAQILSHNQRKTPAPSLLSACALLTRDLFPAVRRAVAGLGGGGICIGRDRAIIPAKARRGVIPAATVISAHVPQAAAGVAVQGGPVRHAGLGVREGVEQVGLAVAHLGKTRQEMVRLARMTRARMVRWIWFEYT